MRVCFLHPRLQVCNPSIALTSRLMNFGKIVLSCALYVLRFLSIGASIQIVIFCSNLIRKLPVRHSQARLRISLFLAFDDVVLFLFLNRHNLPSFACTLDIEHFAKDRPVILMIFFTTVSYTKCEAVKLFISKVLKSLLTCK